MNFLSHPIVARLLWALPVLLFAISAYLLWAGLAQREAATIGEYIDAEILEVETNVRSEITEGSVRLRYVPPGETEAIERSVEMPLTYLKSIEARDLQQVTVRALPGQDQIVLEPYKRGQWILSLSFAAMALIGGIGLSVMVGGWNRFLNEHGDPSEVATQ